MINSSQETNLLNSISGLSLLRYQVTLALERTLKVSLRPDAKLALMEGVDLNVTLDNLEIPNWDDNELLFNKYKDQTPIEAFSTVPSVLAHILCTNMLYYYQFQASRLVPNQHQST